MLTSPFLLRAQLGNLPMSARMGVGGSDSWHENSAGPCRWLEGHRQDEKPHSVYEKLWQGNEGNNNLSG